MDKTTRHSIGARITAAGFIVTIIFGNLWLVAHLTGSPPHELIVNGFWAGVALVMFGGVAMLVFTAYRSFTPEDPE